MSRHYALLLADLGLEHCRGIRRGFYCHAGDHEAGFAMPGIVHLTDRRWSWPGAHSVLKLAALATDPTLLEIEPRWRRVWAINVAARELGRRARVRVPARCVEYDRAIVLAGVARLPNTVPDRKRAFDWARRGAKETA